MIVARIIFVIKVLNYHYQGITIKLESYHVSLSLLNLTQVIRDNDIMIYHDNINPSMYLQNYLAFFFPHNTLTSTQLTLVCGFLARFLDLC